MASDPLREAQRDFNYGRFTKVIAQLEPLSLTYRDSHLFHYLLGASCLFTGDIGGASTYLRRAEQLNFRHADTLAALAAVHVRRGETDKAVQLYLDILEREPDNRFAKKSLAFLRSNSDPARISELTNSGEISVLYPKPAVGRRRAGRAILSLALVGAIAFLLAETIPDVIASVRDRHPSRSGLESLELTEQERKNPVALSGGFEYVLTEKEAVEAFDRAKTLFSAWHDGAALVEINRILLSNASPSIKTKVATLKSFVQAPDFTNVKDRYEYDSVARAPRLFEGVPVIWKGSVANIAEGQKGPSFDFLVGYHDKKKLEGIVPVRMSFPLEISPGTPIELLGSVRPVGNSSFELEGIAVHELRESEP